MSETLKSCTGDIEKLKKLIIKMSNKIDDMDRLICIYSGKKPERKLAIIDEAKQALLEVITRKD